MIKEGGGARGQNGSGPVNGMPRKKSNSTSKLSAEGNTAALQCIISSSWTWYKKCRKYLILLTADRRPALYNVNTTALWPHYCCKYVVRLAYRKFHNTVSYCCRQLSRGEATSKQIFFLKIDIVHCPFDFAPGLRSAGSRPVMVY